MSRRAARFGAAALLMGAVVWRALGPAPFAESAERRYTIGFANLTEEPGVTLEGTGFTGADVRRSVALAARGLPVDVVFYDNKQDGGQALANAEDAARRKVDLYVHYFPDAAVNRDVVERLKSAGIRVLAVGAATSGAPAYGVDNRAAGRIGGEALVKFAANAWGGQPTIAILLGNLGDQAHGLGERVAGAQESLARALPGSRILAL